MSDYTKAMRVSFGLSVVGGKGAVHSMVSASTRAWN